MNRTAAGTAFRWRSSIAVALVVGGCAFGATALRAGPPTAANDGLASSLEKILTGYADKKVQFAGRVVDLSNGQVIFDHDGGRAMIPASNMKLVVMAAAIDQLGPDYQFKTVVAIRGKDLVVIGGGDPTFGDEKLARADGKSITATLHEWADKLKSSGVKQIPGNIVVDDSIFDRQFTHPEWPAEQFESWYEAPIGGLNFNANCIDVAIKPGTPGKPAQVTVIPSGAAVTIVNQTVTGKKQTVRVSRAKNSDSLVISGSVSRPGKIGPVTIRDPGLHFGQVLRAVLTAKGIRVGGDVVRERVRLKSDGTPEAGHLVAIQRTPMSRALSRAGKDSLGMMAEGLIKSLGRKQSGVGSWDSGRTAVKSFLQKAGVSTEGLVIDDGSGLSRRNRVSPIAMTQVLRFVQGTSPAAFDALCKGLSKAGIDGTLDDRLRGPDTRGRIFGKTGYINGVRTLSGYVHTKSGKWLAFAFFYNGAASTRPLTALQDKACEAMVGY